VLRRALVTLGVPAEVAATCQSALAADRLLLLARTAPFEVARTYALLEQSRSLEVRVYDESNGLATLASSRGREGARTAAAALTGRRPHVDPWRVLDPHP
jgi:hypothetical protein